VADMEQVKSAMFRYAYLNETFHRESDRGCAVLVMCALEDVARQAIKHRLGEFAGDMMGVLAPPGGWDRLIRSLRLLGLLSIKEAADLDLLRQVRNKFAHAAVKDLSFEHADVVPLIDQVRVFGALWGVPASRRAVFTMTGSVIAAFIAARGFDGESIKPCEELPFWDGPNNGSFAFTVPKS